MKCTTCKKRKAEIKLSYSKQALCKQCFTRKVERRIAKTVRDNKLIQKGDKIAVAISGGKDSSVLLHWLAKLVNKIPNTELIAVHVFRGDSYAVKLVKACEEMCKSAGVKLYITYFKKDLDVTFTGVIKITKKLGTNRCTVCGVMRRRLLDLEAKKLRCNKLALGHNLTDEAQSYLMNFIRGDLDTFGHLGPISLPKRKGFVQRIRPLRDVPEDDVKKYADLKGWSYHPHPCPCRVGSLRFNMLAVMNDLKKARPDVEFSIVSSGDKIRENVIKKHTATKLSKCKLCGEACSGEVCKVCELLALK